MSQEPISIKKIVDHFRETVQAFDKTILEHTDGFNTENITVRSNKAFHVLAGTFAPVDQGHAFTVEDGEITLKLFFDGKRTPQDVLNQSTDVAIKIRQACMNAAKFGTKGIKAIRFSSALPEAARTNDNSIIVTQVFQVRAVFDIG